ncbi:sugar porter family MFS transporter [Carnimonas bestiolae]|uniref:sugar porter family MFS transporter n=1 Tax=Carnimonas bestiolae TaxID=3402172 RepID=UPI003EDBBE7C
MSDNLNDPSSTSAESSRDASSFGAEVYLLSTAGIAAIAGFLYGYDTGIISGALLQISNEFNLSHNVQEMVTSAILVGAVVGALGSGKLAGIVGRRYTIMAVAVIFVAGVLCCGFSVSAFWLGMSRLLLGAAVGGASQIVPVYIAELAPPEKRGRLVTYFNISIGVGILAAGLVGAFLQDVWSWRTMIMVAAIPAAILAVGMIKLPESPRWLVGQKRIKDARRALGLVRESNREVMSELRSIEKTRKASSKAQRAGWSEVRKPWVRPALVAGLGVAAFTQLSGIEMMIYYTPTFLSDAGFSHKAALYSALGVAVIYLVMTIVGKLIVDHVGRRKLALIMMPPAALSLFGLGAVWLSGIDGPNTSWLIVGFLFAFMVFNAGGIQVIGWLMGSELYPVAIREKATSLHAATLWGSNLILTGTALSMVHLLTIGGAMWFYALLNVLGFLFILFLVPETKGKSLEQIEADLQEGNFTPLQKKRHAASGN